MKYSPLVVAIGALIASGCVHSYYELRVEDRKERDARVQSADNEMFILDTVHVKTSRTIFYSDEFEYVHRYSDGDRYHLLKEALCRFPTILIEIPFFLLNCSIQDLPISFDGTKRNDFENGNVIVRADIPWYWLNSKVPVLAVTNSLDSAGLSFLTVELAKVEGAPEDESPRSNEIMKYIRKYGDMTEEIPLGECSRCDYVYFTGGDECYVLKELKYKAFSFCGIAIDDDAPVPFVWRIDLKAGKREPVVWLDKGKIVYASKDKKRDAEGQ